ncbi:MAG: flagellar basal-body rod protein FlgF [bacterium]|jgi:flagellar basal-body rod protein FlgF
MTSINSLVHASGALERQLDTVANNLANASTTGYKADQAAFKEVLATVQRVAPESTEESFLSHEYLDEYVGMERSTVKVDEIGKNFTVGRLRQTGNQLDLALEGQGFFTVSTPQGMRYTRAGNFQLDGEGRMVTHDGFALMGQNGEIRVNGSELQVDAGGQVVVDGQVVDSLQINEFRRPQNLQKLGANLFAPVHSDDVPIPAQEVSLKQGMLEDSNVNTVLEMTRMITAQRAYETVQRAISNIDRIDERAISIARVG